MPQWTGLMSRPPGRPLARLREVIRTMHEACDRCGYSKVDGQPIASARFRVQTGEGELHLCGHHFRKHRAHIMERAYEVHEVSR